MADNTRIDTSGGNRVIFQPDVSGVAIDTSTSNPGGGGSVLPGSGFERVGGSGGVGPGFLPGFQIPAGLKDELKPLESRLLEEQKAVEARQKEEQGAEAERKAAREGMSFGDKFLRWLPGVGNQGAIDRYNKAVAIETGAEGAIAAAEKKAAGTERTIVEQVEAFLRASPATTFAALERQQIESKRMLDMTQAYLGKLRHAVSEIDSAVGAKQFDTVLDAVNGNKNNGFDFTDMNAMSAKNDAQAAVEAAKAYGEAFKMALENYRQAVAGGVGSLGNIDIGSSFFDMFTMDSVMFGIFQISDMESAKSQVAKVEGQVEMIERQVAGIEARFRGGMEGQIKAVRRAIVG